MQNLKLNSFIRDFLVNIFKEFFEWKRKLAKNEILQNCKINFCMRFFFCSIFLKIISSEKGNLQTNVTLKNWNISFFSRGFLFNFFKDSFEWKRKFAEKWNFAKLKLIFCWVFFWVKKRMLKNNHLTFNSVSFQEVFYVCKRSKISSEIV